MRIHLPTLVRAEFDLLQSGLHELLWKYGQGEKMNAKKSAEITGLMMKLRIHSKAEATHVWGPWLGKFRLCVNGYCSAGQYRNGKIFTARPERTCRCRDR